MSFIILLSRCLVILLPWPLRRWILRHSFGYKIHPTAHIGLAWVFPKQLTLEADARIGDLTVCKNIEHLHLKESASIGRGNWISGFPLGGKGYFEAESNRMPRLIIGRHTSITHRHLIDCTNTVILGDFTTIAGYNSQILTHSINLEYCRQTSASINIGDYCFVGTNCILLPGSALPNYSVLGAKSLLNKAQNEKYTLYGGVPAHSIKVLSKDIKYFKRKEGHIN